MPYSSYEGECYWREIYRERKRRKREREKDRRERLEHNCLRKDWLKGELAMWFI